MSLENRDAIQPGETESEVLSEQPIEKQRARTSGGRRHELKLRTRSLLVAPIIRS